MSKASLHQRFPRALHFPQVSDNRSDYNSETPMKYDFFCGLPILFPRYFLHSCQSLRISENLILQATIKVSFYHCRLRQEWHTSFLSQTDKKSDLRPFYLFVIYKNKKYFSVLTYAHSFNSSCSKYPLASDLQYKYQNPKQKLQSFPLWRWQ